MKDRKNGLIISMIERLDYIAKKVDEIQKKVDEKVEKLECDLYKNNGVFNRLTRIETWGTAIAFILSSSFLIQILFKVF